MYEVEEIVSSRTSRRGKKQYLIKWVGYDSNQNTWEPQRNLVNVKDLLTQFQKKEGNSIKQPKQSYKKNDSNWDFDNIQDFEEDDQPNNNHDDDYLQQLEQLSKSSHSTHNRHERNPKKPSTIIPSKIPKHPPPSPHHKQLTILGMAQLQPQNYIYKIQTEGKTEWVTRNFLIPNYMLPLLQFYQSKILFKS